MSLTHNSGPLVIYGQLPPLLGGAIQDYNTHAAPSTFYAGTALLDSRTSYAVGQPNAYPINCFYSGEAVVVDATPSAIAANNIAASQVPVAATPLTLVSTSGAGITVGVAITNALTGAAVTGLKAIDTALGVVTFSGTTGGVSPYDPSKSIARNVRIITGADETGATFTVVGYDLYGYPMTETITGVNNATASGKKAFKYIASVTPAGTLSGTAVTVGTGDVFGIGLRADRFGQITVFWNSTLITANTGFVAAVTTTASATTGDTRGTYAVQSASDGTKTLQIVVRPNVVNLGSNVTTGLFGVTQA